MYDEELAATGIGSVALGGLVFESWMLALVGLMLVGLGVVLMRVTRRS